MTAAPTVPETHQEIARTTYRYLRWLMVVLPAVLFAVTILFAIVQHRLESSISATYGTPVRDVFVGVMVATAACMVAYQGASSVEDHTLNGAGFYAVFVALIPTNLDETLGALRAAPPGDGPTVEDYVAGLRISVLVVVLLCLALVVLEVRESRRLEVLWRRGTTSRVFVIWTSVVLLVFVGLAAARLYLPKAADVDMSLVTVAGFHLRVHDLAAILLISALAVAVWSHAWPEVVARLEGAGPVPAADRAAQGSYRLIFWLMVAGPVVAFVFAFVDHDHWVIFLEWWEIAMFGWFWVRENRRTTRVVQDAAAGRA